MIYEFFATYFADSVITSLDTQDECCDPAMTSMDKKIVCCKHPTVHVPLLCPDTVCEIYFVEFVPVSYDAKAEEVERFIELLELLCDDFAELLHLNFVQFWCQLLFSKSLRASLDSILDLAPRTGVSSLPESARTPYTKLLSLVFAVFIRATNVREGESDYFAPKVLADLLYDHYILDIPKMVDLCAVFHGLALPHLVSILSNAFIAQERYLDDLKVLFRALFDIFDRIESTVFLHSPEFARLSDVVTYLYDISWSLYSFLSTLSKLTTRCPIDVCFEFAELERFATFFERVFSCLHAQIEAAFQLSQSQRQKLSSELSGAAIFFIRAIREGLLEPCILERIRYLCENKCARSADSPAVELSQLYVNQKLQLLKYQKFSLAMQLLYPSENDLLFLRRVLKPDKLDDATSQYLLNATECLLFDVSLHSANEDGFLCNHIQRVRSVDGPSVSEVVREIKEPLPHQNFELTQRCLDEFCDNPGHAVDAATEGNIAEHAIHANRRSELSPTNWRFNQFECPKVHLATAGATVVNVQPNQVWQGKRETSLKLLGKREKRVTMRSAFSIWEDDADDDHVECEMIDGVPSTSRSRIEDIYEDEYDDSYDIRAGILAEKDSNEHPGPCSVAGAYGGAPKDRILSSNNTDGYLTDSNEYQRISQPYSSSMTNELSDGGTANPRSFAKVPFPEVLSSDVMDAANNPSRFTPSTSGSKVCRSRNDRDKVDDGRHFRGVHKARFGNHNRRRLADRKRQF